MVKASQGPAGETSGNHVIGFDRVNLENVLYSHVAPESAAEASMVGRFQLLMVSRTPSSSSPLVVKPVTFLLVMIDFPVAGSMIPGNMAPPWQLL